MWSMGSAAPSPKVFSPPLGSRQNPPVACGKRGALAASAIFPPPPAHAAGFAEAGGGGGGPRRGSSLFVHAAREDRASAASAASEGEVRGMRPRAGVEEGSGEGMGAGGSLAPFFIASQS